ncbi:membrane bound cation transporter [Histoplasma capsulatum var. duboisii H88]|uniref:Membrane bound cation transporter n=2 Tax=Ajellomyces capsulatus TaxID=5037 RepID=F0UJQ4_AJEC8|nr:membrane bound cation transporter [Histoplasma capsulatum var. duboisii H88]
MAMWLSSVVQYLPSLGAVQLDSAREVIISQKPAKFSFPYRIARHLHISVDAHETSLGLNSHSNHDHNPSLPIADPSVQKIDSTDSIGSQPSCQYGSKATLTKEATSVCPPASTKSGTGDGENSASVETVEKGSLILQTCHTVRLIILSSWVNWALLFVPVGITLGVVHRIMGHKSPISPTVKEVRVVQASLLGSILANLLLILGMCFLFGGLRYREQTAFHASFSNLETADTVVLKVSRGTSVILLLVYVLYLLFQLKSHAYFYESTPQHKIDEESHPGVLADMLNSSSSSESSSSSDSDSDGTTGSNTRALRIKNALKKRRRRKHSLNSKDMRQSLSSTSAVSCTASSSSQPIAVPALFHPEHHTQSTQASVELEVSRDERNVDETNNIHIFTQPISRDFAGLDSSVNSPENGQKTSRKCHSHNKGKNRADAGDDLLAKANNQVDHSTSDSTPPTHARRQVSFVADIANFTEPVTTRRPFTVRSLSTRPVLPRVFTNRPQLHSTQSTSMSPSGSQRSSHDNECSLRRTNSLPGRLQSPLNHQVMPSAQPLPHLITMTPSQSPNGLETEIKGSFRLSRTASVTLLVVSTGLVAVCAELLVHSIEYLVENTGVSQAFIGLIILPIVGNAAEHITAVTVAGKNKMDLAIGVALGSSIQIALFVTPIIVLLGWCLNTEMSLYFSLFETVSLFASAFIVNYLVLDGRTNYLEGALLISAYIIIALAAFFYPSCENLSMASGPHGARAC